MYKLYYKNESGNRTLLGIFPGSPFWTATIENAEETYGKEHIEYEFDMDLSSLIEPS